jgi:hypothetical protein
MALFGAAGASTVAIGVTVVATLVVVALALALLAALRAARDLRAAADDLRRQADALVAEIDGTLSHAGSELQRVDDLIGSAEHLSRTVSNASGLAYASAASPVIKLLAFGRGTARASRRLRSGPPTPLSEAAPQGRSGPATPLSGPRGTR